MKILNFVKIVLYLAVSLFFIACDKPTKTDVISGETPTLYTIFSKTCNEGSVKIQKQTISRVDPLDVASTSVAPTFLHEDFTKIKSGDKVTIKGQVKDGSPCYSGGTSFTCEARLTLGTNRAFICESGTVGERTFVGGDIHVFGNGTKTYVRLITESSSKLIPHASCIVSFSCL